MIRKGLYLHPGGAPVVRTYGYVGNVIWQCERIFESPDEKVNGQVFNVGDEPIDIYAWADAFSEALRGRHARRVPRPVLRSIGWLGDIMTAATGKPFPLTSSRYRSMTHHYRTPLTKTLEAFGQPPFSLGDGVRQTVEWLETYGWN